MRRIKTYVLMVGVALSVTPIFHSSHAQQSAGNTQLLLDVQTLRQEVAELRDMVERQQYQMKRLQRTIDSQVQPNSHPAVNGYNQEQSSNAYPLPGQVTPQTQQLNSEQNVYGQVSNTVNQNLSGINTGQVEGAVNRAGSNVNQVAEAAANQLGGAYPPVVDRSFSTTSPSVPVTGAGSQVNALSDWSNSAQQSVSGDAQELNRTIQQTGAEVQRAAQSAQYQAQSYANSLPPEAGVVAVPQLPSGASVAINQPGQLINQSAQAVNQSAEAFNQSTQAVNNSAQAVNSQVAQAGQAINAGQVPIANTPQQVVASNSAIRPENEFYSEGIALLKQSQYEQAAVVFEKQLEAHPQGGLADGAHYWIAEAMFLNRKLDVAKSHLKTIINDYPQSTRLPNAMLKTAYIEQSQGNQIEARILFQEIVALYPQSDAAIAAKNQLAAQN